MECPRWTRPTSSFDLALKFSITRILRMEKNRVTQNSCQSYSSKNSTNSKIPRLLVYIILSTCLSWDLYGFCNHNWNVYWVNRVWEFELQIVNTFALIFYLSSVWNESYVEYILIICFIYILGKQIWTLLLWSTNHAN